MVRPKKDIKRILPRGAELSEIGKLPDIEYQAVGDPAPISDEDLYRGPPVPPTYVENIIKGVKDIYGHDFYPRFGMSPDPVKQAQPSPYVRNIEKLAGKEQSGPLTRAMEQKAAKAAETAYLDQWFIPPSAKGPIRKADVAVSKTTSDIFQKLDYPFAVAGEILTAYGALFVPEKLYSNPDFHALSGESRKDITELLKLTFTTGPEGLSWRGINPNKKNEITARLVARNRDRPLLIQLLPQLPLAFLSFGTSLTGKSKMAEAAVRGMQRQKTNIRVSNAAAMIEVLDDAKTEMPGSVKQIKAARDVKVAQLGDELTEKLADETDPAKLRKLREEFEVEWLNVMEGPLKEPVARFIGKFPKDQVETWVDEIYQASARYPKSVYEPKNTANALRDLVDKGLIPSPHQVELLERFFGSGIKAARNKNAAGVIQEIKGLATSLAGSIDFSAAFKQAWILSTNKSFYGAGAKAVRAFADPKYADDVALKMKADPDYKRYRNWGMWISEHGPDVTLETGEEIFRSNLANKIPFVRWSSRAHATMLNQVRFNRIKAFEKQQMRDTGARDMKEFNRWRERKLKVNGVDLAKHSETMEEFVRYANFATGRGNLGGDKALELLSYPFWAPRLAVSRIQAPAAMFTKNSQVRKEVIKDTVGAVSLALSLLGFVNLRYDARVNLDPTSGDFGKGRVGNIRFDFFGGHLQIARLIARLLIKPEDKGVVQNAGKVVMDFLRTKLHPVASQIVDMRHMLVGEHGEDFVGRKIGNDLESIWAYMLQHYARIYIQEVIDLVNEEGFAEITGLGAGLAVTGQQVSAYRSDTYEVEKARVELLSNPERLDEALDGDIYGLSSMSVPEEARAGYTKEDLVDEHGNPDTSKVAIDVLDRIGHDAAVAGAQDKYNEILIEKNSEYTQYKNEIMERQDIADNGMENAFEDLWYGKELRNAISNIKTKLATEKQTIRRQAKRKGVFTFFEDTDEGAEISAFDAALEDYNSQLYPEPSAQLKERNPLWERLAPMSEEETGRGRTRDRWWEFVFGPGDFEYNDETKALPYSGVTSDSEGNYDFERHNEVMVRLEELHGKEMMQRIEAHKRKHDNPVLAEFHKDRERLRAYWEWPDNYAIYLAETDPAVNKHLPEAWRRYKKMTANEKDVFNNGGALRYGSDFPATFKYFLEDYPAIRNMEHRIPQSNDPPELLAAKLETERLLAKWGHITLKEIHPDFVEMKNHLVWEKKQHDDAMKGIQTTGHGKVTEGVSGDPEVEREIVGTP